VIGEILPVTSSAFLWLAPFIHVFTVGLLLALYLYRGRVNRITDAFIAVLYLFFAFSNHIAVTQHYGLAAMTGNIVPVFALGLFWVWETRSPTNRFTLTDVRAWRYWVVPFAVLAFWSPLGQDLSLDLNPLFLLTSSYGVMFCPTTPIILTLLTIAYPKVNRNLLTMTSIVGLMIGMFNIMGVFMIPGYTLWLLLMHVPLVVLSVYGLLIPRLVKESPPGLLEDRKQAES
jgi:hypothetical protein